MENLFPHLIWRGGSQQATSVWINPARSCAQRYTSVFILAITRNSIARMIVETDLAAVAVERGLKATRSIDVYPKSVWAEMGPATKEELWEKIRSMGCDAIYTVSLLDVKSEQRYIPATGTFAPLPRDSFYCGFDAYFGYVQMAVSGPGYYTKEKMYFLEGNVFDAATGEIQWSMQSIAYDPPDLEAFSKEYARLLVDQLNRPQEMEC